jgi:hypothetical protein
MKINYFDLGSFAGEEIEMFVDEMSSMQNSYRIYAFEANPKFANNLKNKFAHNNKIQIQNLAIYDKNSTIKLFLEMAAQAKEILSIVQKEMWFLILL